MAKEETNKTGKIEIVSREEGGKVITTTHGVFYSAPLPPASEFERYEKVLPGSADRIIKLAENQSSHRRFIEKVLVFSDSIKSFSGLIFGLIIAISGILSGAYLIINDKSTQGLVALVVPLGTIVGAFIYQKKKEDKD